MARKKKRPLQRKPSGKKGRVDRFREEHDRDPNFEDARRMIGEKLRGRGSAQGQDGKDYPIAYAEQNKNRGRGKNKPKPEKLETVEAIALDDRVLTGLAKFAKFMVNGNAVVLSTAVLLGSLLVDSVPSGYAYAHFLGDIPFGIWIAFAASLILSGIQFLVIFSNRNNPDGLTGKQKATLYFFAAVDTFFDCVGIAAIITGGAMSPANFDPRLLTPIEFLVMLVFGGLSAIAESLPLFVYHSLVKKEKGKMY